MADSEPRRYFRARTVLICAALALSVSCSPIKRNHGYFPPEEDLAQIAVGQDTRDSVAEKIGAPLNTGYKRRDTWYYVASRRETRGLLAPKEIERQVLTVDFTDAGRVRNIRRFGLEDGRIVTLTSRITESSIADIGFLQGVFGNVGAPSAEDFINR